MSNVKNIDNIKNINIKDIDNDDYLDELSPSIIEELEKKLLDMKQEIQKSLQIESNEVITSLKEEESADPDFYNRISTETANSVNIRATDIKTKILLEINTALQKIKDGEYGRCEATGELISIKRLYAIPYAKYSLSAQEQIDANKLKEE